MASHSCERNELAVVEGALSASLLGKMLAPTLQQVEKKMHEAYQRGVEWWEDTYRWITGEPDKKEDEETRLVTTGTTGTALGEIVYFSGLSSACSMLPSASSGLVLASVNIGPFSMWTFGVSSAIALVMMIQGIRAMLIHREEIGVRHVYYACAGACGISAAGQVAFLVLNNPAIVGMHLLPFVTVSNFFAPMMNPFVVLHLFTFSTELPLMIYIEGRISGLDWKDLRSTTLNAGLFGVLSILSASTKTVWLRLVLLGAGTAFNYQMGSELQAFPQNVANVAPARAARMWERNLETGTWVIRCVALAQPLLQATGAGYLNLLAQNWQMDLFNLSEVAMLWMTCKKIFNDKVLIQSSNVFFLQQGQAQAAGHVMPAPAGA